ncbi:bifunctional metallophosphatase/5'-nucleotidase [Dellaglioa algida]|uniref:Multifunctional 2',3'-cyclic-nucleotide 2'-phosphodiesterase/5'-nucleotidase/3'-nucleotidase n=1 Tax=Dellaglioa algida TaxID=105612 RepID=A0A5C6M9P0_9LACO|nr:metallophosphatase [Dellaglioa algida]MDK1717316.1 metallophosphatase [Dellaglioa algida]MDK1720436.1 metallophosphatase [Dellaglioa algida]MDK1722258.1 metallophosphatase [Dellaglioa algida]MDK1723882.1 metallophosphatase [Dellaglioa algida]MDK1725463.1 metallophosphatase [Dellaglioa algida]
MEKITILHTNDIHSHLENWPKIRRFLQSEKINLERQGQTVLTFDIGDAIDRVHPLSEATNGKANIELMNTVKYDAVTIGNNEGIGNSRSQLQHLYDDATFDIIIDNVVDGEVDSRPSWATEYKLMETAAGTKIGIIALTAPFPMTYEMNGWESNQIDTVLPTLLKKLVGKVDVIILLSHLGLGVDRKVAQKYPQIDIILGGHSHHLLKSGEIVNDSLLAAAGKWGMYIGEVSVELENHNITQKNARVIETEGLPEISSDQAEIAGYRSRGESMLTSEVITNLPRDLNTSWTQNSELMQVALKAIELGTKTDIAMLNGGLLLKNLQKGVVTKNDLHQTLPHPMRVITVKLTGYNLIRLMQEIKKNRSFLKKFPIRGMGFRGQLFGEVVVDGLTEQENGELLYHKQKIVLDAYYTFATVDHFMYIPFFPTIEITGEITINGKKFLRDYVGDYLKIEFSV